MRTLIKILCYILFVVLLYLIAWYSWGNYARNFIVKVIDNNLFISNTKTSYDKVGFSGFPFNLRFYIKNLNASTTDGTTLTVPKIKISTNLTIKDIYITLQDSITIAQKDSPPILVNFNNDAKVTVKLYSSAFTVFATSEKFNTLDIATITYKDHGYSISNIDNKEKFFISNNNSIRIQSFVTSHNDYTLRIKANVDGRGSNYSDNTVKGDSLLETDIIITTNYNNNLNINSLTLNFIKFILSSNSYSVNVHGNMNYKRHFGFDGQVSVNIVDVKELFNFLSVFLTENKVKKWYNITQAMNQNIEDGTLQNNNVFFSIIGNQELRWGNLSDYNLTKLLVPNS